MGEIVAQKVSQMSSPLPDSSKEEKPAEETRQSFLLSVSEILADEGFNCRGHIDPSTVIDLAEDIDASGLMYPPIVRANTSGELFEANNKKYKYALVAGFRRFIAYRILKRDQIPCYIEWDMTLIQARVVNLRENLFRQDLNIIQEANAIAHFKGIYTHEEIGRMFGQSRGWAQVRCNLLELPEELHRDAAAGLITQNDIKALHSLPRNKVLEAARAIKERRQAGQKVPTGIINKVKPKNIWKPKIRNAGDMEVLQDRLRNDYGGGRYDALRAEFRFACRVLGWASGNVSDGELERDIEEVFNREEVPSDSVSDLQSGNEGRTL